jgi:hypothetical protein
VATAGHLDRDSPIGLYKTTGEMADYALSSRGRGHFDETGLQNIEPG